MINSALFLIFCDPLLTLLIISGVFEIARICVFKNFVEAVELSLTVNPLRKQIRGDAIVIIFSSCWDG